jgi:hypothetical protein
MRRLVVAPLLLLAAVPADALAVEPAERPPLRARLVACETGATAAVRYAIFTGSMPALPGAARMEMRFDMLQRHVGGPGYSRVPLPKWGQWEHTERRGIAGFIFTKRVEQLSAPATYRAAVRFRWFDSAGHLLRTARRISAPCRQLDPRPDLEVGTLTGTADGRYLVEVVNDGLTDAAPFSMTLGVGGQTVGIPAPSGLAEQRRAVTVEAPRCAPGELVRIALDTADDVQEGDELDDAVTRSCPFG